jgi:hypothetical protein
VQTSWFECLYEANRFAECHAFWRTGTDVVYVLPVAQRDPPQTGTSLS